MIRKLLRILGKLKEEESVEDKIDLDPNNIYVRLRMAMDRIGSSQIQLTASPASLGNIESFTDTLEDLLKSLAEVNETLKESKHIDNSIFFIKKVRTVKLDRFLFVKNGYYVNDAPVTLQKVLEQIDTYYQYMKDADKALYGPVEHNHRQLYSYTETLIDFLNSIFHHFGE
jgi:uncharacterized membrane protein